VVKTRDSTKQNSLHSNWCILFKDTFGFWPEGQLYFIKRYGWSTAGLKEIPKYKTISKKEAKGLIKKMAANENNSTIKKSKTPYRDAREWFSRSANGKMYAIADDVMARSKWDKLNKDGFILFMNDAGVFAFSLFGVEYLASDKNPIEMVKLEIKEDIRRQEEERRLQESLLVRQIQVSVSQDLWIDIMKSSEKNGVSWQDFFNSGFDVFLKEKPWTGHCHYFSDVVYLKSDSEKKILVCSIKRSINLDEIKEPKDGTISDAVVLRRAMYWMTM
jgi:hypothetical protein